MSLANLDPELRPNLEAILAMPLDFSPDGLQEIRQLFRTMADAATPDRPDSVRVENVVVPGPGR